jgi:hypothetical protein
MDDFYLMATIVLCALACLVCAGGAGEDDGGMP